MNTGSTPLISIIVPVYNVHSYLDRCLYSLKCQTYRNLEFILVDDGSTDSSLSICEDYRRIDNRFIVIHKSNGGVSSARNMGLDICKGEYISFVDADDFIHPRFIEILYDIIHKYNADISQCCSKFVKASLDRQVNSLPVRDEYKTELISGKDATLRCVLPKDALFYCIACDKLFSKRAIDRIRFPEIVNGEDVEFCYRAFFEVGKVAVNKAELYYYCKREGSATTTRTDLSINLINVFNCFDDICIDRFKDDELKIYLEASFNTKLDAVIEDYWGAFRLKDAGRKKEIVYLYKKMRDEAKEKGYSLRFKAKLFSVHPLLYVIARWIYSWINYN